MKHRLLAFGGALVLLATVGGAATAAPLERSPLAKYLGPPPGTSADAPEPAAASGLALSAGNRVALLSQGYEALLLRVHLIRAATQSIDIQTFIWTNDEVGRLMIWELIQAARRGVKVRIIADHLFSDQDPEIVAFLASVHPNFEVRHYRPATARMKPGFWRTALASLRSFHDFNQRMHSKVMVVDGAALITGGRNIENTYYDHAFGLNFRDRDVLVVGPVVATAQHEFEEFWRYRHTVGSRELVDVRAALKRGAFRRFERREDYDFGGFFVELDRDADDLAALARRFSTQLHEVRGAAFLYDAPGKSGNNTAQTAAITRDLTRIIQGAKSSVVMQTPYLVLSGAARDLFRDLKSRSPAVTVRVGTNSFASTDNLYAYSANYRLRNEYVDGLGLSIFEFKPRPAELLTLFPQYPTILERAQQRRPDDQAAAPYLSVHAKSLVVDDTTGFVGSFNLDPRSERLNTEVGLLVVDAAFATALRAEIERDLLPENSWTIAHRRLPLRVDVVNRLVEGVLSLSPIDLWPIQNTSSFELLPGHPRCPRATRPSTITIAK